MPMSMAASWSFHLVDIVGRQQVDSDAGKQVGHGLNLEADPVQNPHGEDVKPPAHD